jgi:hypothetical protein
MVVRIAGRHMYLWRAVDQEGEVLNMLVQRRRDSRAALRLMRKLLRKQGFAPKLLVTDKLRSYGSAVRRLGLGCPQEQGLRKKQSGGEFASGGATARTQAAAVQIGEIRPTVSQHPRRRPQHLLLPASSHLPIDPAKVQSRSDGALAGCGPLRPEPDSALAPSCPMLGNVTKPPRPIVKTPGGPPPSSRTACTESNRG